MTVSAKASIRWGALAAATSGCIAALELIALGAINSSPWAIKLLLLGTVAGLGIYGYLLVPRSWQSRLIIRPQALASASVTLFAVATLLLQAAILSGDREAPLFNFCTVTNRQELDPRSALTEPALLKRMVAVQSATHSKASSETLPAIAVSTELLDRRCVAHNRAGACAPGGNNSQSEHLAKRKVYGEF